MRSTDAERQPADDSEICNAIELSLAPGVGRSTQNRIAREIPDIGDIFSMGDEAMDALGVPHTGRPAIRTRALRRAASEILEWRRRMGGHILLRGRAGYPRMLEEIYDPPLILYAQGRLESLQRPLVAIVGTRKPTVYGLQMAEGLAADLGGRGIAVVSGLARGIDAAAHRGCMEATGCTIAVLGCGIDIVYPPEHRQLTNRIIERGLILSEFPPGVQPAPHNFPARNRIISGLSLGSLVIEAREYSGSLITARLAMEQNREVFALPGPLTSPQSFGPNFLIKQGAKLVQSWRDVVEELPREVSVPIFSMEEATTTQVIEPKALSDEESGLLGLLKTDEATQFDTICHGSGLTVSRLSALLLKLETDGLIRQLPGNSYVRTRKTS